MKTVEEYMKLPYTLELTPDPDEGGFVASYPDLPGCGCRRAEKPGSPSSDNSLEPGFGRCFHWWQYPPCVLLTADRG